MSISMSASEGQNNKKPLLNLRTNPQRKLNTYYLMQPLEIITIGYNGLTLNTVLRMYEWNTHILPFLFTHFSISVGKNFFFTFKSSFFRFCMCKVKIIEWILFYFLGKNTTSIGSSKDKKGAHRL